jgi:Colicin immunity protein / pyocin immunity protein
VAPGDLTREQLIEIVDKIMRCDPPDEAEQDKLLWLFENNVLHPRASSFIYFPEHELGPEYEGRSLTPEQVVDHVLAYKPIELGPVE